MVAIIIHEPHPWQGQNATCRSVLLLTRNGDMIGSKAANECCVSLVHVRIDRRTRGNPIISDLSGTGKYLFPPTVTVMSSAHTGCGCEKEPKLICLLPATDGPARALTLRMFDN